MKRNTKNSNAEGPGPMDPSTPEVTAPASSTHNTRICYALKTLVAEVHELFPETPVEYSNYDGRNTALDVTFDLSVFDGEDKTNLEDLLLCLEDPRLVGAVGEGDMVLVSVMSNPRTQDLRDPFGLGAAYEVLIEDGEEGGESW